MIEFLQGNFAEKTPTQVIVEANGIGYLVHISLSTFSTLQDQERGRLLIHYAVSVDVRSGESRHQLYGFSSADERHMFRQLISISGISAHIAGLILSSYKPSEFRSIVMNGDVRSLTAVKGIGPKLAQKVVTELRDKVSKDEMAGVVIAAGGNSLRAEALSALTALGFDRAAAVRVINQCMKTEEPTSVEELIKNALKQL